jgi:hypothetical protein
MSTVGKGKIVIVNMYDNRYWNIFLDGELVASPHKEDFTEYVLKQSYRQEWAEQSGVKASELTYSLIDLYEYEDSITDYDANDFEEYQDVLECCKLNNIDYKFKDVDLNYIEKKC